MGKNVYGAEVLKRIKEEAYYNPKEGLKALMVLHGYAKVLNDIPRDEWKSPQLGFVIDEYEVDIRLSAKYLSREMDDYPYDADVDKKLNDDLNDLDFDEYLILNEALGYIVIQIINGDYEPSMNYFSVEKIKRFFPQKENEDKPKTERKNVREKSLVPSFLKSNKTEETGKLRQISESILYTKEVLKDDLIGQDTAIKQILDGLMDVFMSPTANRRNSPAGIFFLAGPSGVGKTMASQLLAKGLKRECSIIDMTAYQGETDYFQLIGTDKSYRNGHEGIITTEVKYNKRVVLLFDEIEKASTRTQNIFLQILNSGEYTDEYTHELIDCRETIMIFTSNAGKLLYEGKDSLSTIPKSVLKEAILKEYKTDSRGDKKAIISEPLLSRFMSNTVVMFDNIDVYNLEKLSRKHIQAVCKEYSEILDIRIKPDDNQPLLFLYNIGGSLDARIASGRSREFVKQGIQEAIRQIGNRPDLFENAKSIEFKIDIPKVPDIKKLFVSKDKVRFYLVCESEYQNRYINSGKGYEIIPGTCDINDIPRDQLFDAVIVDPFTENRKKSDTNIGLEDRDIPGVNLIKNLIEEKINVPVYLLSTLENPISATDEESFINNGIRGVVKIEDENSIETEFDDLAKKLYMISQYNKISGRGLIIDYDISIECKDNSDSVIIRYYNLRKKQAVDSVTGQAVLSDDERPGVTFEDVIGAEHAKEELRYYVGYLKDPAKHMRKGDAPARGILMYGPPGTGKTLLARATAGESDCTFFQLNATEFLDSNVGAGEEKVRELFAKARKYAPSIIFIDEIDSIGKTRFREGSNDYIHSILTTLFTEMDGFDTHGGDPVFVLAATNYGVRGENSLELDPGLTRRFNNRVYVELPKRDDREKYLEYICKKKGYKKITKKGISNMADRTVGRSLAELEQVVDLMHRNAMRKDVDESDNLLSDALDEYLYGARKKNDEEYYKKTAVHEAGHAYISWKCGVMPSYVTIVSRGSFGGYMRSGESEDKAEYSSGELREKIRTLLAGRVSEQEFYGEDELNTGVSSDLQKASDLAMSMVRLYGMDGDNFCLSDDKWFLFPSSTAYVERAKEIISEETENCKKLVHEGRAMIQKIADKLCENSFLTEEQLKEILEEK